MRFLGRRRQWRHTAAVGLTAFLLGATRPAAAQQADPWDALAIAGVAALNRGEAADALSRFLGALEMARTFAANDPRLVNSLLNVATAYRRLGRPDQSEVYYAEAARLQEAAGDPELAVTLDRLGLVLGEQGLAGRATEVFRDAITRIERIAGPDHPYTAILLEHLGEALFSLGQFGEATEVYGRIVEIRTRTFGADHRSVAPALTRQGLGYIATSRNLDAVQALRRALAIWRAGDQPPTSELLLTLEGLVEVSETLGRIREAADYQLQVVVARAIDHGERGAVFADELEEYARLLRRAGEPGQADEMEGRAERARIALPRP